MGIPLKSTEAAKDSIQRVRYTHDAMIDLIIMEPMIKQNVIAKHFNVSTGWVSRVICSDAFQARLAQRKGELIDPTLMDAVENNLRGIVLQSTLIISDKLESSNSPDLALKSLELAGKMLGYGARKDNVNLQQNFIAVVPSKSGSVQEWVEAHSPAQKAVVVEAAAVRSAEPGQLSDLARLAGA